MAEPRRPVTYLKAKATRFTESTRKSQLTIYHFHADGFQIVSSEKAHICDPEVGCPAVLEVSVREAGQRLRRLPQDTAPTLTPAAAPGLSAVLTRVADLLSVER